MKELSIEEKARAYDKALERAQKELQACGSKDCDAARQIIRLFPEFAESEDEKVKRIIHSISDKISFHLHDIFTEEEFQCFDAWSNAWLEEQGQQNLASSAKNCKNDTILDLLHKMPSYITVDGIYYHFMLRKAAISYMAFYEGEGEGGGKVIFWTAGDPIAMLTAMLEKLKEKGLLE